MTELGESLPELKRALIDERDTYLAQKIRDTPGRRIVAVVGAGHLAGMIGAIEAHRDVDLSEIEQIPPVSPAWKWVGWGIPTLIVGSIVWIGITQGFVEAGENALYWFLANAIPTGLGGLIAFGHPLTILAAFFGAPFTSLTPVIGAGYVAAFVQTWYVPPTVQEIQGVGGRHRRRRGVVAEPPAPDPARLHPDDARQRGRDLGGRHRDRRQRAALAARAKKPATRRRARARRARGVVVRTPSARRRGARS